MFPRFRTAVLVSIVGLSLSAFVSTVGAAGPPSTYLVAPGEPYGLPKFGFSSTNVGFGERIASVRPGGRASRLGLEPGDVILSVNNYRLTYTGSWNDALSRALYDGGSVRLQIRDVRTGHVHFRQTYVGNGGGPVPYFKTGVTVAPQPHVIHHNSGIQTIAASHLFN